jgi:acyl-CoA synthetase (AMP-forming)/AMP-acid ligase II
VVAAQGHQPSTDDLVNFCRGRLANFKVPRQVWFVERLPVNAAGKVHKPDLRASAIRRMAV